MTHTDTPAASLPAFVVPNTVIYAVTGTDCTYRVSIAVPAGAAPVDGFPVMYVLDANAGFATVVETHRRLSRRPDATHVGPAIIVGIGHESDAMYDTALRQRDFGSGADHFLSVINQQIKPLVNRAIPVDPDRQILAGHSLAGFFTLWVLRHHPEAFNGYVALSPSLWSDIGLIEGIASMSLPEDVLRIFLAVGEWEENLAPWQAGKPGSEDILQRRLQRKMVSNVRELGAVLTRRIGTDNSQCIVFPEEDHASVFAVAISRAMRMML